MVNSNKNRLDPNAKAALEQYRYEIANEFGITNDKAINTENLSEAAKNQMGNKTELRRK